MNYANGPYYPWPGYTLPPFPFTFSPYDWSRTATPGTNATSTASLPHWPIPYNHDTSSSTSTPSPSSQAPPSHEVLGVEVVSTDSLPLPSAQASDRLSDYITRDSVIEHANKHDFAVLPLDEAEILHNPHHPDRQKLQWLGDAWLYVLVYYALCCDPRCARFRRDYSRLTQMLGENQLWFWLVLHYRLDRYLYPRKFDDDYCKSKADMFELFAALHVRIGGEYLDSLVQFVHAVIVPMAVDLAAAFKAERAVKKSKLPSHGPSKPLKGQKRSADALDEIDITGDTSIPDQSWFAEAQHGITEIFRKVHTRF